MDFALQFPRNQIGDDSIFPVGDIFSKMTHFVICKMINDAMNIVFCFSKKLFYCMDYPEVYH